MVERFRIVEDDEWAGFELKRLRFHRDQRDSIMFYSTGGRAIAVMVTPDCKLVAIERNTDG